MRQKQRLLRGDVEGDESDSDGMFHLVADE